MSEKGEIIVQEFTEDDRLELIQYLWKIFRIPAEQHHWIYETNPRGPAHVVVAREQATGRFAGSGAFFPWKFRMQDGKVARVFQYGNVMTHPDFRRRGVFGLVTHKANQDLAEKGSLFVYSYSNDLAYPGHRKNGAITIGFIRWLSRPLNLVSLLRQFIPSLALKNVLGRLVGSARPNSDRTLSCRRVDAFDERFDQAEWPALRGRITAERDAAYLNWKYMQRPNRDHCLYIVEDGSRLLAYAVILPGEASWTIMDMQAVDQASLHSLLRSLMRIGTRQGIAVLSFAAMEGHPYISILQRLGFFFRRRSYPVIIYPSPAISLPLPPAEEWLLTLGDQD